MISFSLLKSFLSQNEKEYNSLNIFYIKAVANFRMLTVQLDQMMIIDVLTRWGNVLLFRAPHWLVDMLSPEQSLTGLTIACVTLIRKKALDQWPSRFQQLFLCKIYLFNFRFAHPNVE